MDETDRKILDVLKEDARTPYTDIADELGVSEGTVRNRVESLKEEGAIERFTVEVSDEASAVVMVDLEPNVNINGLSEEMPGSLEVYEVAGGYDLIVRFSRESMQQVNSVLDAIRALDGVSDTTTFTVLNTRST